MATYIPYNYYTLWSGGLGDQVALDIFGQPQRFRVGWGDGSAGNYAQTDVNGDGVVDAALAFHRYAEDGVYNISVRPIPADDFPPRHLRAYVHAHSDSGRTAAGGDLDDIFLMSEYADKVRTGNGVNWVAAGAGDDSVLGGNGTDFVDGGAGNDVLRGGGGSDQMYGGDGNDVLLGGAGGDLLYGGDGDDRLYSEAGGSYLFGDAGRDRLFGGDERDILTGGPGVDLLTGGAGGDIFSFGPDSLERDIITDWGNEETYSQDYIDLLDWSPGLKFIGADRFSGTSGEVRFVQGDAQTIVFGDVDGDKVADFSIALLGSVTLTASDFLIG